MAQYPPIHATAQQGLSTKVTLSFSCKDLLDRDVTSKTDPLIQIMMLQPNGVWGEIGRTEKIENTLNPEFAESITIDYRFEEVQKMKFTLYDIDNASTSLNDDDYLGHLECSLAQIVSSKTFTKSLIYKADNSLPRNYKSTITICAEEVGESNLKISCKFRGSNLDKKDTFSKSDPYIEIYKGRDETFKVVHRTPFINNTLNPNWPSFDISVQQLCSNDYDMQLKIKCYDYDDDGEHDLIGECFTTFNEMLKAESVCYQWELINPKKMKKKKNYKNSGTLVLETIKVRNVYSFLDYVLAGCQINFTVGIDFTGSNGDPNSPNSLHFMNRNQPNEYLKALVAVGEVCQDYDSDKMYPALGFGARIPPQYEVSFEFPLNFNPSNPYCQGIFGIVAAYQSCIPQIKLWGPTNVSPIIKHVVQYAKSMLINQETSASNYFILLLLTDGVISDMEDTIDAIIAASYLPISLIIVGVGNADFSQMDFLDCDHGKLRNSKREALRDIVQFVPFRNYINANPATLARDVLAEVPKQVVEYYDLQGIKPNSHQ